ncbi:hypothetical protein SAY86_014693 [Trapa natans]|uniref:EF-hand domain-containing protein n=1 Tax=Trapa natans TaxID=22666 RepID=A0AAN7KQ12_TRANT|nr:hypothetical protein SAY86_014693 [Trapa natans]
MEDPELRKVFDQFDTDGDGRISISELSQVLSSYGSKNGLISTKELHMVMSRLNMKCTIEDCGRMVNSVDSDGDGNVNLEEFKKMMTATITRCRWQWSMDPTTRECVMSTIIGGGGDEEKEQ